MNHSNISLGGTVGPSSAAGYQNSQHVPSPERKPELIRAFDEYACLLERLAFTINQLEDRLSMYCDINQEKDSEGACRVLFASGAAARLSNNNDALSGQIRRLEVILSTLEI